MLVLAFVYEAFKGIHSLLNGNASNPDVLWQRRVTVQVWRLEVQVWKHPPSRDESQWLPAVTWSHLATESASL